MVELATALAQVQVREGSARAGTIAVVAIIVGCWLALAVVCWLFWRAKRRDDRRRDQVTDEPVTAAPPSDGKENLEWRSARSS